jgi:hypothetical protein
MSRHQTTLTARHRGGRPTMAAEPVRHPAGEEHVSPAGPVAVPPRAALDGLTGLGTMAVVGLVTGRDQDSLTVHVRRGGPPAGGAGQVVTYRVAGPSTHVYKGGRRTTLDEIAVGDLVLVHTLVALAADRTAIPLTAARIHGLTPSRRALGA